MKLIAGTVALLSSTADGRDKHLIDRITSLQRGLTIMRGGRKFHKDYEKSQTELRMENRDWPYCSSGDPSRDNCYAKCYSDVDCIPIMKFYAAESKNLKKCNQAANKIKKDPQFKDENICHKIKTEQNNDVTTYEFNGEIADHQISQTIEIEAGLGKFIDVKISEYDVTPVEYTDKWTSEQCAYGGFMIFAGAPDRDLNYLNKLTEFCGSSDDPVQDFKPEENMANTKAAAEIAFEDFTDGEWHTIQSSHVIIAAMTNDWHNSTLSARGNISWRIAPPPSKQELLLQPDYFQKYLQDKFNAALCAELQDFEKSTFIDGIPADDGTCKFINTSNVANNPNKKKIRKVHKQITSFNRILEKTYDKKYLNCYHWSPYHNLGFFDGDSDVVSYVQNIKTAKDALFTAQAYLNFSIGQNCQVTHHWTKRIENIVKFIENRNVDPYKKGALVGFRFADKTIGIGMDYGEDSFIEDLAN